MRSSAAWVLAWGLALSSCATSSPPAPETLLRETTSRYAPERYIVGVGKSSSWEDARQRAIVSIGAQIQATLRSVDTISARSESFHGDEGARSSSSERIVQEIRQETHFSRPEWIQVVESHKQGDEVWVLAVLDRQRAAMSIDQELMELRSALRRKLHEVGEEASLAVVARRLPELRETKRQIEEGRLVLAALRRAPLDSVDEFAALDAVERAYETRRRQIPVALCLGGESAELPGMFTGGLIRLGIKTVPCDSEGPGPGIRIEGRLSHAIRRSNQPGAFPFFCAVHGNFLVYGAEGELLFGGREAGLRSGGSDESLACSSSVEHLAEWLASALGLLPPAARR